ncbi:MAG: N-formylglutamate amidohydrolase [Bacilli bacterium]|nr:N-formylglutamate amidohydrolase [Bacilli bacterium]
MNLIEILKKYEDHKDCEYFYQEGSKKILITAVHTMYNETCNKMSEPLTKAISLHLAKDNDCYSFVKIDDDGIDSNKDNEDLFKKKLVEHVKSNDIKLVLDIHGASRDRDFDIELGNLNNLSSDFSTIRELQEAFIHSGIDKISINDPFKGGAITKNLYFDTDVDILQIEINYKYRDLNEIDNINKLLEAITYFINQYDNYQNR